jgi:hypothetical protein
MTFALKTHDVSCNTNDMIDRTQQSRDSELVEENDPTNGLSDLQ